MNSLFINETALHTRPRRRLHNVAPIPDCHSQKMEKEQGTEGRCRSQPELRVRRDHRIHLVA